MYKERESDVEAYLVKAVTKQGGIAFKFTSPQRRAVPDRLCIMPLDSNFFVECKATGELPTAKQEREHERLRRLGQEVYVIDGRESVDALIQAWLKGVIG